MRGSMQTVLCERVRHVVLDDRLHPASEPDPCDAPSLWVFPFGLKGKGFAAFCGCD